MHNTFRAMTHPIVRTETSDRASRLQMRNLPASGWAFCRGYTCTMSGKQILRAGAFGARPYERPDDRGEAACHAAVCLALEATDRQRACTPSRSPPRMCRPRDSPDAMQGTRAQQVFYWDRFGIIASLPIHASWIADAE